MEHLANIARMLETYKEVGVCITRSNEVLRWNRTSIALGLAFVHFVVEGRCRFGRLVLCLTVLTPLNGI